MAKLIVNPNTSDAWEFELQPGANLLGRSPANDLPIDHPSISDVHCQLTVRDSLVSLKDLGSATGTLLDEVPVTDARLGHGQLIRLGDIVLRFEAAAVSPASGTGWKVSDTDNPFCTVHRKAVGRYACPECETRLCDLCVTRRNEGGMVRPFCRACGSECTPLKVRTAASPPPEKPYSKQIGGAFTYPFKGDGLILLGAGTAFYSLIDFLSNLSLPLVFLLGALLGTLGTAYLIGYYQRILVTSANGEDTMPDWPDFTNLAELMSPLWQFLATLVVSFGPAILLMILAPPDAAWTQWAIISALVFGCVCFPMAFMAVAMAESVTALNPLILIPSIFRIFGPYILAVILLAAIVAASWIGSGLLSQLPSIPLVPVILSRFLGLYFATVEMRLLGLLFRCKEHELHWFGR